MISEVVWEVYCDGDFQEGFATKKEAEDYVRRDIKGMAETYGKTQKWVKEHFKWTIERVEY